MEALFVIMLALINTVRSTSEPLADAFMLVHDRLKYAVDVLKQDVEYYTKKYQEALDKIGELENKVWSLNDQLTKAGAFSPAVNNPAACWLVSVPVAWAKEYKIHAIKCLRAVSGLGLKEGKEQVEAYIDGKTNGLFSGPLTVKEMLTATHEISGCREAPDFVVEKISVKKEVVTPGAILDMRIGEEVKQ